MWTPRGERPIAPVAPKYQWLYVYSFVHPRGGQTEWMLMPAVNTAGMNVVLAEFARAVGAGPDKQIVLVWDQAGWHRGKDLVVPDGLHVMPLLAYTPELQPAERLWPLLNEAVANQAIPDLDSLEQKLVTRCQELIAQPKVIQNLTCYHWWPNH